MKDVFEWKKRRNAQTLVFFLLAWGTIMLLCGLAIDSGLLYLAKARMGRAVDGAALAAVGNFNRSGTPTSNRDQVAVIMRNFAVANFTALSSISSTIVTPGGTPTTATASNGTTTTSYSYNFNDGTQDPNGAYRRFVQVTLTTGSGGAITGATCNARCPVQTYFIGYASYAINGRQNVKIGGYSGPTSLIDLKVSSSAVATRNPRLIMVVLDRSASMLATGGGATGLAPAVVQFLDFFDTSSDSIGIVSFGSSARLEMPMTTNFIIAGTNDLIDAYETNLTIAGLNTPGDDPESVSTQPQYQSAYTTSGIRRMKFGGQTAADEGIRLALEQMMGNSGFNDPDVVKYMVIFTDGKWNASRTLFAAPGYINEVTVPLQDVTHLFLANAAAGGMTNGHFPGPWNTDLTQDGNLIPMPSLGRNPLHSSLPYVTNAMGASDQVVAGTPNNFSILVNDHTNDVWQSADASGYEPLGNPDSMLNQGAFMGVTNTTWIGQNPLLPLVNYYTQNVDVWLQPGSVAYFYPNALSITLGTPPTVYVSDYTNPTKHINLAIGFGGKIDLVVPGYVIDGIFFDGLDLAYSYPETPAFPRFRSNNYQEAFMWSDDSAATSTEPYNSTSLQRELMFRNYPNLLTGFYIFRPDDPLATYTSSQPTGQQGIEPLITDQTTGGAIGAPRALYGLGAYYPSAGFYWPFGGETDANGYVTNAVGVDYDPTYALLNPNSDPDPNYSEGSMGGSRHIAYSINMLSTNAAPEWAGELFYNSISGGGTNVTSGTSTTSASQIMHSADWQVGAPTYLAPFESTAGLMISEATHDTNIVGSPSVWRPVTFNGSNFPTTTLSSIAAKGPGANSLSTTGGYVSDGQGNIYPNAMAWSGRPTHYYDFSHSSWEPITDNHDTNVQALQLGNWKATEYAWHARALGVTIYTVGYGTLVTGAQQAFLAQIANATNTTAGGGSNIAFNASQPIGQQFYATTASQISNDFYSIGQAINAALTQ
jgi:Flp pilus assembly protein TadG/Mg-chelatase subunit ChlD